MSTIISGQVRLPRNGGSLRPVSKGTVILTRTTGEQAQAISLVASGVMDPLIVTPGTWKIYARSEVDGAFMYTTAVILPETPVLDIDVLLHGDADSDSGDGTSISAAQGWDGTYVGSTRVAKETPPGVLLEPLQGPFDGTQATLKSPLGAVVDLSSYTELYLMNVSGRFVDGAAEYFPDETMDGRFIWRRATTKDPWTPVADNRAWDGTRIGIVSYAYDTRPYSLALTLPPGEAFIAPRIPTVDFSGLAVPLDQTRTWIAPPRRDRLVTVEVAGTPASAVFIKESGAEVTIPLVTEPPHQRTDGPERSASARPWTPQSASLPGGTPLISTTSSPIGTTVRVLNTSTGAHVWTKSVRGWYVSAGDTGSMDFAAWSRAKAPQDGYNFTQTVRYTQNGYEVLLSGTTSTFNANNRTSILVALPLWTFGTNGNVDAYSPLPADSIVYIEAQDANGDGISNWDIVRVKTVTTDYVSFTFTPTGTTPRVPKKMVVRISAPQIVNWPADAYLNLIAPTRPKP